MIKRLHIKGFKSVKDINIDSRRINLFIGEPNTGKSNILESLGLLSAFAHTRRPLKDFVRMEHTQNLFYDGLVESGAFKISMMLRDSEIGVTADYVQNRFQFKSESQNLVSLDHEGRANRSHDLKKCHFVKFYRFRSGSKMDSQELGFLVPPDGDNLASLIFSSKELRQLVTSFFDPYGWQFVVKPHERKLEIQKQSEGIVVNMPYFLASDTLQRMIFFRAAIESNRDSTLVFEEPEAHAFPFFTKHLGERIALDEYHNQYFIATHNPYLLSAILEKAPSADIAVFVTYYRDYETRVKLLSQNETAWLFEADPFFSIEQLLQEKT